MSSKCLHLTFTSASSQIKFICKKQSLGTLLVLINEIFSLHLFPSELIHRLFCVVRSNSNLRLEVEAKLFYEQRILDMQSLVEKLFYFSISKQTFRLGSEKNCKHFDDFK